MNQLYRESHYPRLKALNRILSKFRQALLQAFMNRSAFKPTCSEGLSHRLALSRQDEARSDFARILRAINHHLVQPNRLLSAKRIG